LATTHNKPTTNQQQKQMKQKNVKQKQKFFLENTGYVELFNRMPYGSAAKIRERMIKKKIMPLFFIIFTLNLKVQIDANHGF
jgi:hypothetical protein